MTKVKVGLVDQRQFDAKVLIADANMDLAVLQIEGSHGDFPTVPLTSGDTYQVGDLVLAIGNPYGLGQTVTSGIVSAIRRIDLGEGEDRVFIQTDAAINKGNSGGALVNMRGQLIGINSAILSPSGASAGIGFAIPSSLVRLVVAAAEAGKTTVVRPWLGATLQEVTPDLAQSLGLARPTGALITEVSPDSPAKTAGLVPGDLVTAVDGHQVADPAELRYLFTTHPVGQTASLSVDRHGKDIVVPVKVEPAPNRPPRDETTITGSGPFSGAVVDNINPQVIEELGLSEDAGQGVVVASVRDGSTAEQVGFQKGDRVLALNDHRVTSTHELQELNNQRSAYWRVTIDRGGRRITQVLQY
jgi:Do/DeqQ family serine protease